MRITRFTLFLGLAALLAGSSSAGCQLSGDIDSSSRCDPQGAGQDCPEGQSCINGFCQVDALSSISTCGTTDLLVDGFDARRIDYFVWDQWCTTKGDGSQQCLDGLAAEQTAGTLVLWMPALEPMASIGLYSEKLYLFDSSQVTVEVLDVAETSTVETSLNIVLDIDNRYSISHEAGQLLFSLSDQGKRKELERIAYNRALHRFWRLRAADRTIFWETSVNGSKWDVKATSPDILARIPLQVELSIRAEQPQQAPVAIRFGSLNATADDSATWCPMASLTDAFDDGQFGGNQWGHWDVNDSCDVVENGSIGIYHYATGYSECGIYSRQEFRLDGSFVTFEAVEPGSPGITTVVQAKRRDRSLQLEFIHESPDLVTRVVHGDGSSTETSRAPYDPSRHRWWRLIGLGSTASWEVSVNGYDWTPLASYSAPEVVLDAMQLVMFSYAENPLDMDQGMRFDNMNLLSQ